MKKFFILVVMVCLNLVAFAQNAHFVSQTQVVKQFCDVDSSWTTIGTTVSAKVIDIKEGSISISCADFKTTTFMQSSNPVFLQEKKQGLEIIMCEVTGLKQTEYLFCLLIDAKAEKVISCSFTFDNQMLLFTDIIKQ